MVPINRAIKSRIIEALSFLIKAIKLITGALTNIASKKPPVGPIKAASPAPLVNTGSPMSPKNKYTKTQRKLFVGPKTKQAKYTNKV